MVQSNSAAHTEPEPHPIMWTPRPNAGCFSSEIDSYRIALEVDGYLTGISPLRARCIVLANRMKINARKRRCAPLLAPLTANVMPQRKR